MKKIITAKLKLKPETVRILQDSELGNVAGGGPKPTRDTPCIPPPP